MLAFPAAIRIYVALAPVDTRKQYDGLWAAVQEQLGENPKSGAVFCFTNKERTRLKLLYWEGTGVWVLAKRLEQGRFSWPEASQAQAKLALAPEALGAAGGRRGAQARFAQAVVRARRKIARSQRNNYAAPRSQRASWPPPSRKCNSCARRTRCCAPRSRG